MTLGKQVSFKQTTPEMHGQCCCDFGNADVFEIGKTINHGSSNKNMEFGPGCMKHVEVDSGKELFFKRTTQKHMQYLVVTSGKVVSFE